MRRRTILAGLAVLVAAAAALAGMRLYPSSSPDTGLASPAGDLTCAVKTACDPGEVAVFRMSGTANAHAQTAATATYGQVVCCQTPAPLGTDCAEPSGAYDTVLKLSAADNAHVAQDSEPTYGTEVCLSPPGRLVDCQYGPSCDADYACLATILGTTNAHVADCDGLDDYGTKVCCSVACVPPFTTIVNGDSDCDGAPDEAELGDNPFACGTRNPDNPWDFYDVPAPTIHNGGDMNRPSPGKGGRNTSINVTGDVLAVLEYSGTGAPPRTNCNSGPDGIPNNEDDRCYTDDKDEDGNWDGLAYDRKPGFEGDPPHAWSDAPNGAISITEDVLLVLAQSGTGCP